MDVRYAKVEQVGFRWESNAVKMLQKVLKAHTHGSMGSDIQLVPDTRYGRKYYEYVMVLFGQIPHKTNIYIYISFAREVEGFQIRNVDSHSGWMVRKDP
jgi:hypothetical protein